MSSAPAEPPCVRPVQQAATPVADNGDVRAAAAGDRQAFHRLYQQHVGQIYGCVLRLVGYDHARAEDLTQDAFVRAWQKLAEFRFESAFGSWLYRLAVNVALMDLRSRRAQPVAFVSDDALPEPTHTPFCAVERDQLERAIADLPPRARAVLVLHDVEGWRHEDIGAELVMAVGTSKAQLHRARQLLRKALGDSQ